MRRVMRNVVFLCCLGTACSQMASSDGKRQAEPRMDAAGATVACLHGEIVAPGTSWKDKLRNAPAGATICLRAGETYPALGWIENVNGTAQAPIRVVSVDASFGYCSGRARIVNSDLAFQYSAIIQLHDSSYITLDCLEVDGRGASGSAQDVIHIDSAEGYRTGGSGTHSHHITLVNVYAHHAQTGGDVLKANQVDHLVVRDSEFAFPGRRDPCEDGNCWQECLDFLAVDDALIERSFFHDGTNMLAYIKGGSMRTVIRGNLFSRQGPFPDAIDPAFGIGGWTDARLIPSGRDHEPSMSNSTITSSCTRPTGPSAS
jgi:hypothetical protein